MSFKQKARRFAPGSGNDLEHPVHRQRDPLTFWLHSVVRPSAVTESRAVYVPLPPRLTELTTVEPLPTENSPDWSMLELLLPDETTRSR